MSTFSDQLLIKSLFQAPIQDHLDQEIVQAESRRFTYAQFRERVARLAAMLAGHTMSGRSLRSSTMKKQSVKSKGWPTAAHPSRRKI